MAIAGSPGIPSTTIWLRSDGHLGTAHITNNKPSKYVESDLWKIVQRLRNGDRVEVDVRHMNIWKVAIYMGTGLTYDWEDLRLEEWIAIGEGALEIR
jgi:hypothetical protein